MRGNGRIVAAMSAAAGLAFFVAGAWAGTETRDGDAKMNLGEFRGVKHAVGCVDFENESGWSGQWDLGRNLTAMLESALHDTGRFVLVEREKLGRVTAEQDLAAKGRAAPSKVAQTGLLRSARYLATGAVTEVEEDRSGGTGGIQIRGIRLGGGKGKAQVTIIAKLIDSTTGEMVSKKRIVGLAGRTRLNVGLTYRQLNTDLGGFAKTPLAEAAQDCINQAAKFFAESMADLPVEGSVVKSTAEQVIINRGTKFGVEAGQEFVMRQEGEQLLDPDTGAVLGREEGKELGRLKVVKTAEAISYCTVLSGERMPKPGTVVVVAKP